MVSVNSFIDSSYDVLIPVNSFIDCAFAIGEPMNTHIRQMAQERIDFIY